MDFFSILLPIVYALVGAALIWFVIELAITVRKVRGTVTDLKTELQPSIDKVDPLMDRATLTVDSVNLELMRVDGILEDVSNITSGVSKATDAVGTVTSAPIDIVTNMTKKVRSKFKPKYASDESVDLGSEGVKAEPQNPIAEFVTVAGEAAAESFQEQAETRSRREQAAQAADVKAQAENAAMNDARSTIVDAVNQNASSDAEAGVEADKA